MGVGPWSFLGQYLPMTGLFCGELTSTKGQKLNFAYEF